VINRFNDRAFTQVTLIFSRFGGQDMAGEGVTSFDLAGAGFAESFGSAPVGLHFRHRITPLSFFFFIYLVSLLGRQS
jgi:hypothetical protein